VTHVRLLRLLAATAVLFVAAVPAHASSPAALGCKTVLAAGPVGTTSCPGVRPGALYSADNGNGCSMSFIFRGSDTAYYAASAGHCIWATSNIGPAAGKEAAWGPGAGMIARDATNQQIGRFAYGIWNDTRDFSLIRLDSSVHATAAMCYFGGPTSMYTAHSGNMVFLKHFGNGLVFGDTIPARTAFAPDTLDPLTLRAYAMALPGDSGSGVMTADGAAIGTLVDLYLDGTTGITRLDASIAKAEQFMKIRLTLQTAKLDSDVVHL
jgi:hypothetical protein